MVVVVKIPEGLEKPYSCRAGYYRRLNGTTQKMNHDEIRVMFCESDMIAFEEKSVKRFTLSDISRTKIIAFTKESVISIGKTSAADFLQSLKVADEKKVSNAGILFFAKDVCKYLPQAQTTLLAFKGTEKFNIYDRLDVSDDLLTQFNEAIVFIQKHLNVRSEIKGVNRTDIYEIPLEAIREAVVNALMHRDYSITGTQVSVEIYDNRIEIVNPGGLPKGLSKKAFGTMSVRRNELIADLFFRLHKVERIGMGIKRMKKVMKEAGLKEPAFETNGFFKVVFQRPMEGGKVTPPVAPLVAPPDGLTDLEAKILKEIANNPRVSRTKLAKILGIGLDTVKEYIGKLKAKHHLKRVGKTSKGYWKVKK